MTIKQAISSTFLRKLIVTAALSGTAAIAAAADSIIAITGKLDNALSYRLQVDYKTTINSAACQFDDYVTGMRIPLSETRYFAPEMYSDSHRLHTSLQLDKGDGCAWQPKVIALCVDERTALEIAHCQPLFIIGHGTPAPVHIAINCSRRDWLCKPNDNEGRLRRDIVALPAELTLDIHAE